MLKPSMWAKALYKMPRLDKEEWDQLDLISRWLIATRAAVLMLTFTSSAIGGLLAWKDGRFDLGLWVAVTVGLCLAHATNNLLNDLTDHWKGVDKDNYFRTQYGPQPIEQGLLSMRNFLGYVAFTGTLALATGIYLVFLRGEITLVLLGAGAFFVLFYTYPLKYIGLGELAVLAVWGPLMVGGTYQVVTGTWSWSAAMIGLPWALGATAVIFGKHIDKLDADRGKKIRTLPVILGAKVSRYTVLLMIVLQYLSVIALVALGHLGLPTLLVLGALPAFRWVQKVYRAERPEERPEELPADVWPLWYVALAFWHTRRFGLLFMVGLVADVAISQFTS